MNEDLTLKQEKAALHLRIWLTALIGGAVFVGMNWFLSREDYSFSEGLINGLIFATAWVLIHYIMYRKKFSELKSLIK